MRDERHSPCLDQDRNSDGLHDDVGGNTGNAHAKDGGHDHDEEACEVKVIVMNDGQDEVAHVEPHRSQCDCTDDDADDNAADTDRNRALRAFDDSRQNLVRCHSRILAEPAGADCDKDGNDSGIERREACEHEADQADERKNQVSLLLEDDLHVRNIFLGNAGKAETLCLEVDGKKKSNVVEKRRGHCGKRYVGVRQVQEFCHDKADSAHDRRRELAARRCDGFDSARKFLLVTRTLHERNRDRAGRCDIRYRRTINHAHEAGCNDSHLRRAARCLTDKCQREIIDEFGKSAVLQESAKDNEEKKYTSQKRRRLCQGRPLYPRTG